MVALHHFLVTKGVRKVAKSKNQFTKAFCSVAKCFCNTQSSFVTLRRPKVRLQKHIVTLRRPFVMYKSDSYHCEEVLFRTIPFCTVSTGNNTIIYYHAVVSIGSTTKYTGDCWALRWPSLSLIVRSPFFSGYKAARLAASKKSAICTCFIPSMLSFQNLSMVITNFG